jgi:hypothetical protein
MMAALLQGTRKSHASARCTFSERSRSPRDAVNVHCARCRTTHLARQRLVDRCEAFSQLLQLHLDLRGGGRRGWCRKWGSTKGGGTPRRSAGCISTVRNTVPQLGAQRIRASSRVCACAAVCSFCPARHPCLHLLGLLICNLLHHALTLLAQVLDTFAGRQQRSHGQQRSMRGRGAAAAQRRCNAAAHSGASVHCMSQTVCDRHDAATASWTPV